MTPCLLMFPGHRRDQSSSKFHWRPGLRLPSKLVVWVFRTGSESLQSLAARRVKRSFCRSKSLPRADLSIRSFWSFSFWGHDGYAPGQLSEYVLVSPSPRRLGETLGGLSSRLLWFSLRGGRDEEPDLLRGRPRPRLRLRLRLLPRLLSGLQRPLSSPRRFLPDLSSGDRLLDWSRR
jgi:hypothetical protein